MHSHAERGNRHSVQAVKHQGAKIPSAARRVKVVSIDSRGAIPSCHSSGTARMNRVPRSSGVNKNAQACQKLCRGAHAAVRFEPSIPVSADANGLGNFFLGYRATAPSWEPPHRAERVRTSWYPLPKHAQEGSQGWPGFDPWNDN
jgi:hypothetical protein